MSTTEASTIASSLTVGTPTQGSGLISLPGLASGLNSGAIISEIISVDSQPMIQLEIEQSGVEQQSSQLQSLQSSVQTVLNDAMNLSGPGLFDTSQTAASSNPTLVTATAANGAAIGGYQVDVTQLATAASRTYTYTSPSSDDAMTIDGTPITVPSGSTLQSFVNQINSNSSLDVQAAITGTNTLVLSSKSTGAQTGAYIQVSDPGAALSEIGADANAGQNAQLTINGSSTPISSASNTVTNAIPGVSLTLGGVTNSSSGSVTVVVSSPTVNTASVTTAVNQFVADYNSAVNAIEAQLSQPPISDPQNAAQAQQGTLYEDQELQGMLQNMRQLMYTGGAGLPQGMSALSDLGISTGAPSGAAAPSSSALAGDLTVDAATLTSAIQSNPSGVQAVLASFSNAFQSLVSPEAGPGGVVSQRISDNGDEVTQLSGRINDMQNALTAQQTELQQEYSALESVISMTDSQQSALSSEITQMTANTTTIG